MNLVSWNACGLRQNVLEVRQYLENQDIDIMLINETKLTPDIQIKIKNYKIIRSDRTAHGGGVAIIIKNNIPYKQIKNKSYVTVEHLIIQLKNNIHIIAVYNNPRNLFTDRDLLALSDVGNKVLIIGDLNARHGNWKNHITNTNGRTLQKFITNNNLILLHTDKPTHFPNNNGIPTYIDVVINKNISDVTNPVTHAALTSDHNPIRVRLMQNNEQKTTKKITSYKNTDWTKYKRDLDNNIKINKDMHRPTDIDKAVEAFQNSIIKAKNSNTKIVKINNDKLDLDTETKQLINERNKLRKTLQKHGTVGLRSDINRLNRIIRSKIRTQVSERWENTLKGIKPGDKTLWRITKSLRKQEGGIPVLEKDGKTYYDDIDKANLIANTLQKIQTNKRPSTMDDEVQTVVQEYLTSDLNQGDPVKPTSPQEIYNITKKLPNNKTPGQDGIDNKLIKNFTKKARVQLTYIANAILKQAYYPMAWKKALVIPIPKAKKDNTNPENFRPISLLSSLSKVVEKVILSRLTKHLDDNKVIIDEQFGFRKGHGTEMQVARIADAITRNFKKEYVTSMVLLDIEKAFDSVWIDGAIYKIIKTSPPKQLGRLMGSYLQNRQFRVKINNTLSKPKETTAGVPQGSVLGPVVFNIFVNDIPKFAKTQLAVYADDTAIYTHSFNAQVATKQTQIHLDMILAYTQKWKIKINETKTEHAIFTKKFTNNKIHTPLRVNGQKIAATDQVKYLGVSLDKSMSFRPQIRNLIKKGHGIIRTLYPLLNKYSALSMKAKRLLYTAIIKPIITNAAPVWCSASPTQIKHLQRIQNKCLRLVLSMDRYAKIDALHKKSGILTIQQHIHRTATKFYTTQIKNSKLTINITKNPPDIQKHKLIFETLKLQK